MSWREASWFNHSDGRRCRYPEASRCRHLRANGTRCGKRGLKGIGLCETHGGRNTFAVLAAQQRDLAQAVRDHLAWRERVGWPTTADGLRYEARTQAAGAPVITRLVTPPPGAPGAPGAPAPAPHLVFLAAPMVPEFADQLCAAPAGPVQVAVTDTVPPHGLQAEVYAT